MIAILKIFRWPNLAVVVLMQWLLYHHFIAKAFAQHDIPLVLGKNMALLFMIVTALITAGGYVINDLTDSAVDAVNRPNRVIVGRQLSVSAVKWLYFFSVASGYVVALYIAFRLGEPGLIIFYLIFVAGLYIYSRQLKRKPFIGNLWVAVYCAGAAGMLWFAERASYAALTKTAPQTAAALQSILLFFMAFAFLSTLFREIIKDLQDEPGDRQYGYRTAPVVWGMAFAKKAAFAIALLLALLMICAVFGLRAQWLSTWSPIWLGGVLALLLSSCILLTKAATPKAFRTLSLLIKAMMLGGILWLLFLQI